MTAEPAIQTRGLTKSFGGHIVVDGVNLNVPQGASFGFLGPNGSGKTTTLRLLLGLAYPTAGTARIFGHDVATDLNGALVDVGTLVEGPAFYPYLTGHQNLERYEAMGKRRNRKEKPTDIDRALAMVGLSRSGQKRYRTYSLGMRQRLALAHAFIRPRRLLILDEPTNGLDPQGTREVRNLIRQFTHDGTTVFLSSHLLSEIDQVCTHAAVIMAGRLLAQGPIDELRNRRQNMLRIDTPDVARGQEVLQRMEGTGNVVANYRAAGDGWLEVELNGALPEQIAATLVHADIRLQAMSETRPSLEETFVALTGEGFDVAE